ncbi:MAG: hypothetical protein LC100_06225 [Chitinophagales bacterium]|nr:hypothetical protein [Chitinophagales bacterium]
MSYNGNVNVNVTVNGENPCISATHSNVAVTNVSTVLLPENPERKYLLLVNNSDATVFLNLSGIAVENEGIPLHPNGSYEMSGSYITKSEIQAVHNNAGEKTILVTEGV